MYRRVVMIRLVAVLVLVTAAFDYCAFDVLDPTAPMSSAQSGPVPDLASRHQPPAAIQAAESSDDHCLCCAPGISSRLVVLHRVILASLIFQAAETSVP